MWTLQRYLRPTEYWSTLPSIAYSNWKQLSKTTGRDCSYYLRTFQGADIRNKIWKAQFIVCQWAADFPWALGWLWAVRIKQYQIRCNIKKDDVAPFFCFILALHHSTIYFHFQTISHYQQSIILINLTQRLPCSKWCKRLQKATW